MTLAFFLKVTLITATFNDVHYVPMPDVETCLRNMPRYEINAVGENQEAECVALEVVDNLDAEGVE